MIRVCTYNGYVCAFELDDAKEFKRRGYPTYVWGGTSEPYLGQRVSIRNATWRGHEGVQYTVPVAKPLTEGEPAVIERELNPGAKCGAYGYGGSACTCNAVSIRDPECLRRRA